MPMNLEHRQKIVQAKADTITQRQRRLKIGGWVVYRFDSRNIALEPAGPHKDSERMYFPTLKDALIRLLHKLIEETSFHAPDVERILTAIKDTERSVVMAINTA